MEKSNTGVVWRPDCLGDGFEMVHIDMPADYSGEVRCTVVRKRACNDCCKAVLYVHGFSDYFFQKEMAEMFAANGYNFYAVELRKYGRSLFEQQKMFQVRKLDEYFDDIKAAIEMMKTDNISAIALLGHSTGGLTASLYMAKAPSPVVKALMLNSPFLDWNLSPFLRCVVMPVISALGRYMPNVHVPQAPDRGYAESLAKELGGEWSYRRDWKPDTLPNPDMGWVRAIQTAQQELRKRRISVPVLLMHSKESVHKGDPKEKYARADAILDVVSISKYGQQLSDDVTEIEFDGGLHDLALSKPVIRKAMYSAMLVWLMNRL